MSASDAREQIVEACRALASWGMGGVIGGHVSLRVPGEDRYWTHVLDKSFEELAVEDIVLIDFDGNVLEADRNISPGIGFHPGIYQKRPDVNAVVHTHSFFVTAQSAFNRPPLMWHNLCTYFYKRTAVSPDDELESIAAALGTDDVAIVIPWHGAITVGADLPEAVGLHSAFEYAARLDVTLSATGATPMPEASCEKMRGLVQSANYLRLTYDLMVRDAGLDQLAGARRSPVPVGGG